MKKIISVFVLIVVFLSILSACGTEKGESSDAKGIESSIEPEISDESGEPGINIENYGGKEFIILASWNHEDYMSEFIMNEIEGDKAGFMTTGLNEQINSRNTLTEEAIGIKIKEKYIYSGGRNGGEFLTHINTVILSGAEKAHIIAPSLYDLGTLALGGSLVNLNQLEKINTGAAHWDNSFNESATMEGKLYFIAGDMSIYNKNATPIVAFNKKLARILIEEDLYQVVKDGNWTYDKAYEYAKLLSEDTDQNGVINYKDKVGWVGQNDDAWNFFYASGERIVEKDSSGSLVLSMYNQRAVSVIESMTSLFHDKDHYLSANNYFSDSSFPTLELTGPGFSEGNYLFFSDNLSFVHMFEGMEDDFGILPVPKFDKDQEYYSMINPWTGTAYAVPMGLSDEETEFAANCIDVMCYYSTDTVAGEYIDKIIKYQKISDDESEEMLEMILNSRGCDMGIIYNIGKSGATSLPSMLHKLLESPTNNFTSMYESIAGAAESDLNILINQLK